MHFGQTADNLEYLTSTKKINEKLLDDKPLLESMSHMNES